MAPDAHEALVFRSWVIWLDLKISFEFKHRNSLQSNLNYIFCSTAGSRPFKIIFNTDNNEVQNTNAIVTSAFSEEVGAPAGIIGFSLDFVQNTC